jgi:TRAP transporter TAXI family solute receptor
VAFQFVEPAPPKKLTIAAGSPTGAYYAFAQKYAERFKKEGVELVVRATQGSAENVALLADPKSGIDIAFVQGGVGDTKAAPDLTSLGSLYLEPLWVFVRSPARIDRLTQLRGARIAVGALGSGTRAVARKLLTDNGLDEGNARLLDVGGPDAAAGLKAGTLDAAVFITAPTSETVRGLLSTPGVQLLSFARAEAYARRYRFLTRVTLPEGAIDLAANLPAADAAMLAPAAALVQGPELHPALVGLFLQTIKDVHDEGGLLESPGQFPSPLLLTYPLSDDARRFYENGPPFLQRFLPFWAANLLDRLKIMILPLITLLYPLMKILPPFYQWRMLTKVVRWYRELLALEDRLRSGAISRDEASEALEGIEEEVSHITVPAGYTDRIYYLREHIDLLRRRLAHAAAANG